MPPTKKRCNECTLANVDCVHCLCTSCAFCEARVAENGLTICGRAREGGQSGGQRCRSCRRARKMRPKEAVASREKGATGSSQQTCAPVVALLSSIFAPAAPSLPASAHPDSRAVDAASADAASADASRMCTRSRTGCAVNSRTRRSCRGGGRLAASRGGVNTMSQTSGSSNEEGINALCDLVANTFSSDDSTGCVASRAISRSISQLKLEGEQGMAPVKLEADTLEDIHPSVPHLPQPDLDHLFGDLGASTTPEGVLFGDDELSRENAVASSLPPQLREQLAAAGLDFAAMEGLQDTALIMLLNNAGIQSPGDCAMIIKAVRKEQANPPFLTDEILDWPVPRGV